MSGVRSGPTVVVVMAGAIALAAAACSSGSDEDAAPAPNVTVDVEFDGDVLDEVVLPGQRTPATSPAGATSTTAGGTSSTSPSTSTSSTSTTSTSTTAAAGTSTTSSSSTPSSSTSTTSTSTTAPDSDGLRFGPTLLIDDGGEQSTFDWELLVTVPGGSQVATVSWIVDGDAEQVELNDDLADSTIVRIGAEHWRSDTNGTLLPVSSDEYREERRDIMAAVLDTDPGAVIGSDVLDGAGTYEVRTSDVDTIAAVFGGDPPPGDDGVLLGDVELDDALRVVNWSLSFTSDAPSGETVIILEGRLEPTASAPIERP